MSSEKIISPAAAVMSEAAAATIDGKNHSAHPAGVEAARGQTYIDLPAHTPLCLPSSPRSTSSRAVPALSPPLNLTAAINRGNSAAASEGRAPTSDSRRGGGHCTSGKAEGKDSFLSLLFYKELILDAHLVMMTPLLL
ncbi:unnamed protein product [Pleuronectes platessa]|uniref:Uncharacterized protein n=1 Tax=Pleuronectes platessa TaxID=8262 RepID=A0A9N7VRZ9_PLEPL|nr:unnamed protein product [Pleuronectes platessa]